MPKLNGQELVSNTTERAGRVLLFSSFSILVIQLGDLDTNQLNIFGLSLPENVFTAASSILIVYFSLLLIFRWYLDYLAYTSWLMNNDIGLPFQDDGMTIGNQIGQGAAKIHESVKLIDNWDQTHAGMTLQSLQEILKDLQINLDIYLSRFDEIGKDLKLLSLGSKIYIFGIALIIPLVTALCALASLVRY